MLHSGASRWELNETLEADLSTFACSTNETPDTVTLEGISHRTMMLEMAYACEA